MWSESHFQRLSLKNSSAVYQRLSLRNSSAVYQRLSLKNSSAVYINVLPASIAEEQLCCLLILFPASIAEEQLCCLPASIAEEQLCCLLIVFPASIAEEQLCCLPASIAEGQLCAVYWQTVNSSAVHSLPVFTHWKTYLRYYSAYTVKLLSKHPLHAVWTYRCSACYCKQLRCFFVNKQ